MSEDGRIKVIGDWYITTQGDPVNYVVRKGAGERIMKKTRNGTHETWKDGARAYCGSLTKALKFIREEIIAERLSETSTDLRGALNVMKEVNKEFEFMITGKKS